nr:hypothetical protein [Tanacetum cinerariifolium]
MNRIGDLPPGIIESILCFLPIKEAVKTSTREWRYRWMKIPKLVVKEFKFHVRTDKVVLSRLMGLSHLMGSKVLANRVKKKSEGFSERRKFFYAIYQVLLMHEGPLHEFSVSMFPDELGFIDDECVQMDAIIFHLSRKNSVKKLTIDFGYDTYLLPFSIFSFRHLTDLSLADCCFLHQPTFCMRYASIAKIGYQFLFF